MWYPSLDGIPPVKGALTICKKSGLPGVHDKMRCDELRVLLNNQPDFPSAKPVKYKKLSITTVSHVHSL